MSYGKGWEDRPIALDAMGGDHAPHEPVKAALTASLKGMSVLLVGEVEKLMPLLPPKLPPKLCLIPASQSMGVAEPSTQVLDKPDSSIMVGLKLIREGKASAFVSAGATGAIVAASIFALGTISGIERPALGILYPTLCGASLLLDVGANADCRPKFLEQFAFLGSRYMESVMRIPRPTVGILSNGEEDGKGNRLVRESFKLLKESPINFVGNVEGKDLFTGKVRVVVTDGFTGNVLLKTSEAFSEFLFDHLGGNGLRYLFPKLLLRPWLRRIKGQFDYRKYGGAPLLGVRGNVVIAHGRSHSETIFNALRLAWRMAEQGVPEVLEGDKNGNNNSR